MTKEEVESLEVGQIFRYYQQEYEYVVQVTSKIDMSDYSHSGIVLYGTGWASPSTGRPFVTAYCKLAGIELIE